MFDGFGLDIMPVFTIRIWGNDGQFPTYLARELGVRSEPVPVCEIEVDRSDLSEFHLSINGHRGYEIINQKMLPPAGA